MSSANDELRDNMTIPGFMLSGLSLLIAFGAGGITCVRWGEKLVNDARHASEYVIEPIVTVAPLCGLILTAGLLLLAASRFVPKGGPRT